MVEVALVIFTLPRVPAPKLKLVENRFVLDEVVEKELVEVALPIVPAPRLKLVE